MKYIYIKNYLKIIRQRKEYFSKFINCYEEFKVANQKIILNDNSLLLELIDQSDIDFAKLNITNFFKDEQEVEISIPKSVLFKTDTLTLIFKNNKKEMINT